MSFWIPNRAGDALFELKASLQGCVGPVDHQMYMGGASLAAALAAIEEATGAPAVWASAQFLGRIMADDLIEIDVDLQPGRTISQATATVRVDGGDKVVVSAAAGRGEHESSPAQFRKMPQLAPPDQCPIKEAGPWANPTNLLGAVERRVAESDEAAGVERLWMRLPAAGPSPSLLSLFAEFMPGAHPATRGGSGLDLTIRFVAPASGEWILADTYLDATSGGLFHSHTQLFDEHGTLAAIASQTGRLPPPG